MRFLHISDLHLGRRLHDVSLLEDQQYILRQILSMLEEKHADAVMIAGDVYDKAVPSAEAVRLLDWFLTRLASNGIPVVLVSGNHDSAERLSFGSQLLNSSRVYVSSVFEGPESPIVFRDEYGEVRVYLLPFVKPIHVRHVYPDAEINDYTQAVETVISAMDPNPSVRNVLVAHQLVTGGVRSESEAISIGGLDDVSGSVLEIFDYVALGHLHRAQNVGTQRIRYCGTPLAYSFSEGDGVKTVTWVELGKKGEITVEEAPLKPMHAVRTIKGAIADLLGDSSEDYLRVILTDEEDAPNALSRLRYRYPNLLRMEYDNQRTRAIAVAEPLTGEELSPAQLLEDFYQMRNGKPMDEAQRRLSLHWMEEIWEDEI